MISEIDNVVEEAQQLAEQHATNCTDLVSNNQLRQALEYCRDQGIDPPQCSLTAESPNAQKLREKAKEMLSDVKWWRKHLKTKALRAFEMCQIQSGKVTNGISDEIFFYMTEKKQAKKCDEERRANMQRTCSTGDHFQKTGLSAKCHPGGSNFPIKLRRVVMRLFETDESNL